MQELLDGYRVIEIATAAAMPLVGTALRTLGAEVIKLESRVKLDLNRARLPKGEAPDPLMIQGGF